METPPGFKQFFAAFMARMKYSESKNGDYEAENPTSSAVGKYQFLWNTWSPKIKAYAKKQGFGDVDKEAFKKNPELQDAFFENYAKDTIYPKAVSLAKAENKRNLDVDEIGQLLHMNNNGKHVKTYLAGGEFNVGGKNLAPKEYLEKGRQGLLEQGIQPVRQGDIVPAEERQALIDDYFSKKAEIDNADYHPAAKKMKISDLKNRYNKLGLVDDINEFVKTKNKEEQKAFNDEKALFQQVYNLMAYGEKGYNPVNGSKVDLRHSGGKPYVHATFSDKKQKEVLEMLQEANPKIKVRDFDGKKQLNFRLDPTDPIAKYLGEGIKKFNGLDVFESKEGLRGLFMPTTIDGLLKPFGIERKHDKFKALDFNKDLFVDTDPEIKASSLATIEKKYEIKKEALKEDPVVNKEDANDTASTETVAAESAKEEKESRLSEYLNNEMELESPDDINYDQDNFKKQLPLDALAGAALGITGLAGMDNDIPKRDEQISAGVTDYVAKLAELSKMGLPPEVEAEARNSIASGYQMGLKNIVEASAGNRNIVLGNQGSLDLANIMGQSNIAIEDFKAKNNALQQYGQGAMYINEFRANKDIANKQLEQEVAFQKNDSSGAVADAGFSSMINSLQNARENGPGSARHMLSSLVRQSAFGYDPEMKDDGTGKTKGTRSWYQTNVVDKVKGYNENLNYVKENYNMFDNQQKDFMNLVYGKTQDIDKLKTAAEYARGNNITNPNVNNLASAIETGEYGNLFGGPKEKEELVAQNTSNNNYFPPL